MTDFSLLLKPRFKLLTAHEISAMPDPKWIVENCISEGVLTQLYGMWNLGKTFVALDMALSIATGLKWLGIYEVMQGPVVYVAAEGASGIKKRMAAWLEHRGLTDDDLDDFRLLDEALPLTNTTDVKTLIRIIKQAFPDRDLRMIFLDTQERCTEGSDEDKVKDMGVVIGTCERMKRTLGGSLMLIHHPGYSGDHARGSSSVPAAISTQIVLEGEPYSLQLVCKKQKDEGKFQPTQIALNPVANSLVAVAKYPKRP